MGTYTGYFHKWSSHLGEGMVGQTRVYKDHLGVVFIDQGMMGGKIQLGAATDVQQLVRTLQEILDMD